MIDLACSPECVGKETGIPFPIGAAGGTAGQKGVWLEALCKDAASGWTSELNSFDSIAQMFIFVQKGPQILGAKILWAFPWGDGPKMRGERGKTVRQENLGSNSCFDTKQLRLLGLITSQVG